MFTTEDLHPLKVPILEIKSLEILNLEIRYTQSGREKTIALGGTSQMGQEQYLFIKNIYLFIGD